MTLAELKKALEVLRIHKNTKEKILGYFESPDKLDLLNTILKQERLSAKHKMVGLLEVGTREYNTLYWLHPIIEQLCETYDRDYGEMARLYIRTGIRKMVRGYGINKFKYYNEDILTRIEQLITVQQDPYPESTLRLFKYYSKKTYEKYDEKITEMTVEDKYHLIQLRAFIKSRELNGKKWIDSFFDKHTKPFPLYILYGVAEEKKEKVEVKHSKLRQILNS